MNLTHFLWMHWTELHTIRISFWISKRITALNTCENSYQHGGLSLYSKWVRNAPIDHQDQWSIFRAIQSAIFHLIKNKKNADCYERMNGTPDPDQCLKRTLILAGLNDLNPITISIIQQLIVSLSWKQQPVERKLILRNTHKCLDFRETQKICSNDAWTITPLDRFRWVYHKTTLTGVDQTPQP